MRHSYMRTVVVLGSKLFFMACLSCGWGYSQPSNQASEEKTKDGTRQPDPKKTAGRSSHFALLVACQEYDEKELKPLQFTRNDILEFHRALLEAGFNKDDVVLMHDKQEADRLPEAKKIRKQLKLLLAGLRPDDTLVVALAGHGVQFKGEKRNYFCPRDAELKDRNTLLALDEVYQEMEGCQAQRKLLLVDACRNDPQNKLGRGRATVDLESVTRPQIDTVPEGIVALYSCSAGQESYEHPDLKHGIFFYHVLQGWQGDADMNKDGQLTLGELTEYVQEGTKKYARLKLQAIQVPQQKNDFSGVWILRDLARTKTPDLPVPPPITAKDEKRFTNSIGMKLVLIPAGKFMMGSPESEKDRGSDEGPQHEVEITKPFYLGIHEVTVGQFRAFVRDTGYKTEAEKDGKGGWGYNADTKKWEGPKPHYHWQNTGWEQTDEHPVVNVTWNDAQEFCRWLSKKEGRGYRLPTEAQWEYACRARTTTRFYNGNDEDDLKTVANIPDASFTRKLPDDASGNSWDDGYPFTAPVGRFQANIFGLYDMHGNAREWCADCYDKGFYKNSPRQDPENAKEALERVLRGGSWCIEGRRCRSSRRYQEAPYTRYHDLGFRVAADQSR